MKLSDDLSYPITDCLDCPFKDYGYDHEASWSECTHKDHNQPNRGNILYTTDKGFKSTPNWCPLKLNKE
jgi:hypothetical protein